MNNELKMWLYDILTLKQDTTLLITNSRKIVDVRNRIIHGYDTVFDELIWGIIGQYILLLKTDIEALLNDNRLIN